MGITARWGCAPVRVFSRVFAEGVLNQTGLRSHDGRTPRPYTETCLQPRGRARRVIDGFVAALGGSAGRAGWAAVPGHQKAGMAGTITVE